MSKKILVVDDDPIMMGFVLLQLKDAGYDVSTAENGAEGLEKARKNKPDLMVLDLAMPKMHGYEVCKTIKSDPALNSIKIVITSGKNYPVDIRTAKEVGADRYLVKPYAGQDLLKTVAELLEQNPPA